MAKARITFTDTVGPWTLQSIYPDLASRFRNWTPDSQPVGDFAHVLSNEQLYRFRTSWRHGASFQVAGVQTGAFLGSSLDVANKLRAHLLNGGTCSVYTEDTFQTTYLLCGLMPGTMPSIQMTDRRTIEFSMQLSLINLDLNPDEMVVHYVTSEVEAYLMDAGGGIYVFGTGNKAGEAAAFLADAGGGIYTLDSSSAAENRRWYLADSDINRIIT